MNKNIKRRHYFIEKRSQSKFILRFVLVSIMGAIIGVGTFNYLASKKLDSVLYAMRLPESSTGSILMNEMGYAFLVSVVFIIVAFLITAKRLFAKINGPLLKLASNIKRIGTGDLTGTVHLRKGDDFQDFAGQLNHMTSELNTRFTSIKKLTVELNSLAKSENAEPDTINNKLSDLEEALKAFQL